MMHGVFGIRRMKASTAWAMGALLLLLVSIPSHLSDPAERHFPMGPCPVEQNLPEVARMWRLLRNAAPHIPEGESYTVRARDPGEEMYLFMLALAVLDRRTGLPTTYFGHGTEAVGAGARYVVRFRKDLPAAAGERLVAAFAEGTVWRREAP